jgi:transposase
MKKDPVVSYIIDYIKSDARLNDRYYGNSPKRKYKLDDILPIIMYVLKHNIPWRAIDDMQLSIDISHQNVYKIYRKLLTDKILMNYYSKMVDKYMTNNLEHGIVYTDTTVIPNKYGNENIGSNKYYKNKNISKLSIVTDSEGIVFNIKLFSNNANKNDAGIAMEHISKIDKSEPIVKHMIKIKTLVADKGYDSTKIRKLMEKNKIRCIIPKNKRNTKDEQKLEDHKLSPKDNVIYMKRIKIENTNALLKKNRRIDIRYDRLAETYMGFVYARCIYRTINYI